MPKLTDTSPIIESPSVFSKTTWAKLTVHGEVKKFSPNEVIEPAGQASDYLNIVLSGLVYMTYTKEQQEAVVGLAKQSGETISNASLHLKTPKLLGARAGDSGASVLALKRRDVYQLAAEDKHFAEYLFCDLSEQLIQALEYLRDERHFPAWLRVARRLHEASARTNKIDITQTQLADQLGMTRLTVAKAFERLENAGLLKKSYGRISIVDRDRLGSWIEKQAAISP